MARTLYFMGGEDFDFTSFGSVSVDTDSTHYRPDFARCALRADDGDSGWSTGTLGTFTSVWFHCRVWMPAQFPNSFLAGDTVLSHSSLKIVDAAGVVRLIIYFPDAASVSTNTDPGLWRFAKVDDTGSETVLGAVFSAIFTGNSLEPDALDVQITNYNVADGGAVNIWINGTLAFSVSGVTLYTNGATSVSEFRMSGCLDTRATTAHSWPMSYSEVVVAAEDTRNLGLVTLTPAANGNVDTFDTGGVANVNEIVLDDSTSNTSGTPGQVEQYTIGTPLTGTWGIVAVCVAARAQKGSLGGPTRLDMGLRTSGVDYWSADLALPITLQRISTIFLTNPDTSGGFTTAVLLDPLFNIGMKSVA